MSKDKLPKTEEEWRARLSDQEFQVLREKGTEPPGRGYWDNKAAGDYHCKGCGEHLFDSETKFRSGTGWPSFYKPAQDGVIGEHVDTSLREVRTEVVCKRCGGHLGHVFDDGPNPTGKRYCINSISLQFHPEAGGDADKKPVSKPESRPQSQGGKEE